MNGNSDKASPGQPFRAPRAETWNSMIDAGDAYRAGRLNVGTPPPTRPRKTDIIKLKNISGADRAKGEILLIDGKAITDLTEEHIWLLGDTPTADGYFAILKEPIAANGLGDAQVSGCCLAMIDVSDIGHTRAKAAAGLYMLESSNEGPLEIIYSPGTTGEVECVVRFAGGAGGGGGATKFRFELTANYSTGTSVAATIKTMAGTVVGTGITLKDPEAIFLGLPSGSKGYCTFQDGDYWLADNASCAAEAEYV